MKRLSTEGAYSMHATKERLICLFAHITNELLHKNMGNWAYFIPCLSLC
uniref:Uncharacterized protein n=1 Tax=Rhizophora mucronata TaxID=61149 RepID=A0A2P2JDV6_RHIMU